MMRPLEVACNLIDRGWAPVPVAFMGKAPTDAKTGRKISKWETLRINRATADRHFNGAPQNIGTILGEASSGLVDVDLDCAEAIAIAPSFLTRTRTLGRSSAPKSHWFYNAVDAQHTIQLRDPNLREKDEKKTIVELRANGSQTVVFGVHESGEPIEWTDETTEVTSAPWSELKAAVHRLGAAVLLSRYWPAAPWQGPAAHALFGALLDKWEHDDAWTFVTSVLRLANAPVELDEDDARASRGLDELAELMISDIEKRAMAAALAWLDLAVPARSEGPTIDPENEPDELSAVDAETRVQWFSSYLAAIPVEASHDGSGQLVKLAALGSRGFALGQRRACTVLWTWSQTNKLPWSQNAIYRRCEDAMRGPRGGAPLPWGCKILERLERAKAKDSEESDPRATLRASLSGHSGRVEATLANVMSILSLDLEWQGVIAYDAFKEGPVFLKTPPQRERDRVAERPVGSDWTEQDSTRTAAWIAENYDSNPSSKMVTEAMMAIAQRGSVHPPRQYLDDLPAWDGTPRINRFFTTYCGTPESGYAAGVATVLFLSGIARLRRPGCKNDVIVILEGRQGSKKSTLVEALFTPWSSDTPLPVGDKDSYQQLRGVWGYEIAELASFKGRDATRIKSFASSPADNYRPSFERRSRSVPRQCIFIGTTNESQYLDDATGARRFPPVKVPKIDIDAVRRDRDQLWAEADFRFKGGEPWWPTEELERQIAEQTEHRYVGDPWEEPIRAWLEHPVRINVLADYRTNEDRLDPTDGFTMAEVLEYAVNVPLPRQGKVEQDRAQKILRRAGWRRGEQQRHNGRAVRRWFKGGDTPGDDPGDTPGDKENQA